MRILLLCCFLSLSALGPVGCVSAPTTEQFATADYGLRPSEERAKSLAKTYILARLKDPESARIEWGTLEKGWFRQGIGPNRFAWRLPASVNAKNSLGGYVGAQPWALYFRGDELVGLGEPYTSVGRYGSRTSMIYVEVDGVAWPESERSGK